MRTLNKLLACAMALVVPLCTWAQTESEPNNGSGTADPLTYNTAMTGSMGVCSPTDNSDDYFSVAATVQGQLRVQSTMSNTGPTDVEVTFNVRQASTGFLAAFTLTAGANGVPVNDSFQFPCHGGTGTYYIQVDNPSTTICTNYSITYDFVAPVFANDPEPNNGSGTAVTVPVSTQQAGQIDFFYGDNSDYYRLDLPTHGVLNIQWEAEHAGASATGTVAVTLRSSSTSSIQTWNLPIGANSVPSSQTVSIDCRSNSGFYYLSLISNTCGTSYRFSYTVTPPVFANDAEPNDGSGSAITLAHSTPTQGQINFSTYTENSDYYRLDLPTNGILNIQWEAENAGPSPAGTVAATLRASSTGAITTWNLPVGANSVAASQTVSIDCRSNTDFYYLSFASNICGVSYRFSYTVTPPIFNNDVEPNNTSGQATAIPHSTPTQGQINFSTYVENADYYRLDLPSSGILNIHWEGEHAAAAAGSATLNLRQSSTASIQSWTVPVGASSIPASQTVSINCRGNQNFYYLEVVGVSCGISYRLSYTVTPPIYDIAPATGIGSGTATTIDLEAATVEGQIGFFYGQASAYYRIVHTGGPLVLTVLAEHAGAAPADYTIRLRSFSTSLLQTEIRSAGGNSTPLSATVDFGIRAGAVYYIELDTSPCGMSFALQCNDADGDGVCNTGDLCANTPTGEGVNSNGCSCSQVIVDDGDVCTLDACLNGNVTNIFQDADNDLTCDANDGCPNDPNKIAPGQCGCGVADTDTDGDLTADCNDGCPADANKIAPGICGCGVSDVDTDGDLTADCNDGCPADANKIAPGICGCGVSDVDTDGDLTADCNDGCPADANKIAPGICGCGVSDVDTDGDLTADCNDGCPADANKIAPGICGCGVADTDSDNDGLADCIDNCPNLAGVQGDLCDDLNALTINDVIGANCVCAGTPVSCTVNGDCNDNNPCTSDACVGNSCVFTPLPDGDGDGTCDATDGCPADANKIAPGTCGCGNPEPGATCNDNDACTTGDVIGANCLCAGTFADADADGTCDANDLCPGGPEPGTACNDNDACTTGDVIGANCLCVGTFADADADGTCDANDLCPGGPEPGTACNDNSVCTTGDVIGANCLCAGTLVDTDGDGVCDANDNCPSVVGQIGSSCNDNNAGTTNDMLNASCQCVGTPIGGCTENLTLSVKLDGNPTQTTWTLLDAATETVTIASGGFTAGQANTTVVVPICVPVGCYHLRVNDSGSNGITNGGYVLRDASSRRIIDASLGSFSSVSQINTGNNPNRSFCVPISNIGMQTATSCDKVRPRTSPIYANTQPGATGYQFWIYDPHGTYNRRVLKTTNQLVPASLLTSPVPSNLDLNVRVRSLTGTVYSEFGPACRIRFTGGVAPAMGEGHSREMEEALSSEVPLTIYPNPNRDGQLTISMEGLEIADGATVDVVIYDLLGKPVVSETAPVAEGMLNHRMDLAGRIGQGLYVVNVTVDGKLYNQRLVMQ